MMFEHEIPSLQSSNRCAHLRESHRTLRDGSFGVALSQALRALQFGHFETVKPGEILDFSLGKTFLFFLLASEFRSV